MIMAIKQKKEEKKKEQADGGEESAPFNNMKSKLKK
jgi:hypothetical protein